ncbi:DUF460 domain-containing protein [Candidatus Woesearchaeota archaeon]|nr:DUF460 domain-containing protein [Candidatus Woesearchaeota archaeon]
MQQDLIIVGIDPGITTAYAVLDVDGHVRKLKSSKELALNNLLAEITNEGKVLVIGTDVKHIPGLIEKFSAKVGAKVIVPEEDMKVGFKERITEMYNPRDDHQRDALAAALHAFKEVQPMLQKVDETLKRIGKEHLSIEVKLRALKGYTIGNALAFLEEPEDEAVSKKRRLKTAFKKPSRLVEENKHLRKVNATLANKVAYLDGRIRDLLKKIQSLSEKKAGDIIKFKDKKIEFLNQEITRQRKESMQIKQELKTTTAVLFETRNKLMAKKVKNLGWEEVSKTVKEGDILVVEDVNSFSDRSLQFLKQKVSIIIYRKPPAKELLKQGFLFVNAAHIPMRETETLAFIDKEVLERERKKKDMLSTIVREYQEERQSVI